MDTCVDCIHWNEGYCELLNIETKWNEAVCGSEEEGL